MSMNFAVLALIAAMWTFSLVQSEASFKTHEARTLQKRSSWGPLHLRVSSILNTPYLMLKSSGSSLKGNDRYEGFVMDLLQDLSGLVNFTFTITPVKDGKYGSFDQDSGTWNGMVGELLRDEADIIVADLTMNAQRKTVIEFTAPFMYTGIALLSLAPIPEEPFSSGYFFLKPFTSELWLYTIVAFIGVSCLLCILARFSAIEWESSDKSMSYQKNNLGCLDSFWFSMSSLTLQQSGVAPRALSTRMLAATWWIFCILLVCIYISNLAVMYVAQIEEFTQKSIDSVEDLVKQNTVKYGAVGGGSTQAYFKNSQIGLYQRINAEMESEIPSVFVKSVEEGVQRVFGGKYAFFTESSTMDFVISRYCNLTQLGPPLDYRAYGIAVPHASPDRLKLSQAILKLQETGTILKMKNKWWNSFKEDECKKTESDSEDEVVSLSLHNIKGLFQILAIGMGASCAMAILELLYRSWVVTRNQGGSMCSEAMREARFAFSGGHSTAPSKVVNQDDGSTGIILQ